MKDDGGSAFPEGVAADTYGGINFSREPGMTLRDYFAAKALSTIIAECLPDTEFADFQEIAAKAYQMADAMLHERAK